MLGSNNYLGLTHHPKVLEAASRALSRYGSGCTGSRFLNGTLDLHEQLEHSLADFTGKESAWCSPPATRPISGSSRGLVGRGEVVYLDKLDHASIVDGAKMSYGDTERFNHGDLAGLERKMERSLSGRGAMIVVDGVYSMEGDIADVPGLLRVARKFGAVLAVDDAHSIGVLGPERRRHGCALRPRGRGRYHRGHVLQVAGLDRRVRGRAGKGDPLPPAPLPSADVHRVAPAGLRRRVLAALEVIQQEPERREALWRNTMRLQEGFRRLGFEIGPTETPIVPVLVGAMEKTFLMWRKLFDAGVFTNPVTPPAVAATQCRLRTSLMATHTFDQIDYALDAFARIGRELGVI